MLYNPPFDIMARSVKDSIYSTFGAKLDMEPPVFDLMSSSSVLDLYLDGVPQKWLKRNAPYAYFCDDDPLDNLDVQTEIEDPGVPAQLVCTMLFGRAIMICQTYQRTSRGSFCKPCIEMATVENIDYKELTRKFEELCFDIRRCWNNESPLEFLYLDPHPDLVWNMNDFEKDVQQLEDNARNRVATTSAQRVANDAALEAIDNIKMTMAKENNFAEANVTNRKVYNAFAQVEKYPTRRNRDVLHVATVNSCKIAWMATEHSNNIYDLIEIAKSIAAI